MIHGQPNSLIYDSVAATSYNQVYGEPDTQQLATASCIECSVAAVDRLEEVTDGQLTGINFWRSRSRLDIAVTSPYGHDHGQAV